MALLRRLARRLGQELARRPETRSEINEALARTRRFVNDDVKPHATRAWREAKPEIAQATRRLKSFADELRQEYRKGRSGG